MTSFVVSWWVPETWQSHIKETLLKSRCAHDLQQEASAVFALALGSILKQNTNPWTFVDDNNDSRNGWDWFMVCFPWWNKDHTQHVYQRSFPLSTSTSIITITSSEVHDGAHEGPHHTIPSRQRKKDHQWRRQNISWEIPESNPLPSSDLLAIPSTMLKPIPLLEHDNPNTIRTVWEFYGRALL